MGMEYGVVLDEDVVAGAVLERCGARAALHADAVVAHVHGVPDDEHVLALADVDAVAVLRVPGAADRDAVDDHVLAPLRHQVELRGILEGDALDVEGDALDEDALAVREADEVRPDLLLRLVGIGNVVESLEVEGVPEVALLRDGAAHAPVGVPFRIAYLGALHAAPPFAVSVDDAFARDADIGPLAGGDARHGLAVLEVRSPVGREQDRRIPLQMQVDVVFQGDGPGDVDAGRDDEMSASLLRQGADGLGKCLGIV